jgi:HSP20 family molecular chaperone IbpA
MNATAQCSTESFEGPVPKRRPASGPTAASVRPSAFVIHRSVTWRDKSVPIEIAENQSQYRIIVPLLGIDPRKIHVFVMAHSLLIEIRFKTSVHHQMANGVVMESINRRILREFNLPIEIEEGTTTVQVCGASLHITARKSGSDRQASWSQLIHFDTRASLGCV